jgi:5'-nucleotidase
VRVSRQNISGFQERFEEQKNPRGETVYWMTGGIVPLRETGSDDTLLLSEKYVTVTPLCYDMTNYQIKEGLEKIDMSVEAKEGKQ